MRRFGGVTAAVTTAAVVLAIGTAAGPATAAVPAPTDWPQYRADAAHTGDVSGQPGLDPASVASRGVRLARTVTLGSGAADASAAGARAFTIGGFVLAADIGTGRTDWTSTDVETSLGPVAVDHGVVLTDTVYPGPLTGLDAATGTVRWVLNGTDQPATPATAAGGTAYLVTTDGTTFTLRTAATATGRAGWARTLPPGTGAAATPTVAGGEVLVQTLQNGDRSVLTAYAAGTGARRWSAVTATGTAAAPTVAVAGGTVYALGADGALGAYDAATGTRRWSAPVAGSLRAAPAVAGDTVLVGTGDGRLVAVATTTGRRLWQATVGTTGVSTPAVAGRVVWVTVDDDLVAVDLSGGAVLRTVPTGSTVFDRDPVVARDRVLVVAQDEDVATLQVYAPA